jgi:ferredoxin
MRIELDQSKCTAAGQCVAVAPNLFVQREDGIAVLLQEEPGESERAAAEEAEANCPALAITVHD